VSEQYITKMFDNPLTPSADIFRFLTKLETYWRIYFDRRFFVINILTNHIVCWTQPIFHHISQNIQVVELKKKIPQKSSSWIRIRV